MAMGLFTELGKFVSCHIVERVVVESPDLIRARKNLPNEIQMELERQTKLMIRERATNVWALSDAISLNEQALVLARERALQPSKTALRWKFFQRMKLKG